jgi:hypothetical protein
MTEGYLQDLVLRFDLLDCEMGLDLLGLFNKPLVFQRIEVLIKRVDLIVKSQVEVSIV